jgi:hypothetical protein
MRTAPDWFVRQLKQEHDGRLRIRWSLASSRWQIEQKVDTAKLAPFNVDSFDDDAIRALDGYSRVCEISAGSITPCTNFNLEGKPCGFDLKVPYGVFMQVKCPRCVANGFHGGCIVGHFDLSETLLSYLRKLDPNRGAFERQRDRLRNNNKKLVDDRMASVLRECRAQAVDDAKVDIPKRGYSGKDNMWADAPAPRYTKVGDFSAGA